MKCPQCLFDNPETFRFCGQCGSSLEYIHYEERPPGGVETDRKFASVLFSTLPGYTTLTGSIDTEYVKAFMGRLFAESARVVQKFSGTVERFFGDEIVAVFGTPVSHDDDAVRAIQAAREIHDIVEGLGTRIRQRIGEDLILKTGIHSGLIGTVEQHGDPLGNGRIGDAIDLARQLQSVAQPGDILVGQETYQQTVGLFTFEFLESCHVTGKINPIPVYRFLALKERPASTHGASRMQAEFVGRQPELDRLLAAAADLRQGKGGIISICGNAGTGKSRLVKEFKATLNLDVIHWCEGYAYAYARNIRYFPVIDLLQRYFQILEGDGPETIRNKVTTGITRYVESDDITRYLEGLFSEGGGAEGVDPDEWISGFQDAIRTFCEAVAYMQPTIIFLEDLQWADPSTMELLQSMLSKFDYPALFLIAYRPPFAPIRHCLTAGSKIPHQELRLNDLSPPDAQHMVSSMLRSDQVPPGLATYIEEHIGGNPFYLEEVTNALVDSEMLHQSRGSWNLARPIRKSEIARTINGVISARLDRLRPEMKHILQEASVLGRSFGFDVLDKITLHRSHLKSSLDELEGLDLIRTTSRAPEPAYEFKHTLTRDIVYSGLLKTERQEIHERIGREIEGLYPDDLEGFFETLAYHFKKGRSLHKAVDYLIQAGRKSLKQHAVEESHLHYTEAHNLLAGFPNRSTADDTRLIDVLNDWAPVFYYRGRFQELENLLEEHMALAESIADREIRGLFLVGRGIAKWGREKLRESYRLLQRAQGIAKDIGSKRLRGYTCSWLPWICVELGLFDEAQAHAESALALANHWETDHFPFYQSQDAFGFINWARGMSRKSHESGQTLLAYGETSANIRGITWGHLVRGWGFLSEGNFGEAIRSNRHAVEASADPLYTDLTKLFLGLSHVSDGQYEAAKPLLKDVAEHSRHHGSEVLGSPAQVYLAVVAVAEGHIKEGIEQIQKLQLTWLENDARLRYGFSELVLGNIFLGMTRAKARASISTIVRSFGFLIKTSASAAHQAEAHYQRAIQVARAIGAKGMIGQAYVGLSHLYQSQGKIEMARESIIAAIDVFVECEAGVYLEEARALGARLK